MNRYISQLYSVEGKVFVIVGGAGYLCGTMAVAAARAGAVVVVLDKDQNKLNSMLSRLDRLSAKAMGLVFDATLKNDHQGALQKILKRFKKVDVLINGAGTNAPTPVLNISFEEWHAIIDSHTTATLFGCQVFGEQMLKQKKGSIINMSSASANPGLSKAFTYSVAKAGIKNLTQNIAREWAARGVRVNALRPGFFPSEWSMKNFITQQRERAILGHTPMGRYGNPEELVGAVLWLASDAASFVTGAEIAVDGGFSCMTI